ncbi:MAG: hypothetical protein PHZ09_09700 [Eubacteriales bacterium]|jgi:hypothetical protein|nr:hypothetical protein [Eubacteriales bacterium]
MKKIAALLLIITLCLPVVIMTGCKDSLKEKMEELDQTYALLGTRYTHAVYVCDLAGVYNVEDQEELNAKFEEWKLIIQDAGDTVALRLDYDQEEMDAYIAEWNAVIGEIDAVIDQYEVEEETEADETEAETEA